MSRQPHTATLRGGLSQRERIWHAVRQAPGLEQGGFTLADLSCKTNIEVPVIREYFKGLVAAGYVGRQDPPGIAQAARYWLSRDAGIEAPRVRRDGSAVTQGLGQEQMWRTLRLLKGDTNAVELAAHASTAAAPVAENAAAQYLCVLARAGYLDVRRLKPTGKPGTSHAARYRLKANPHGHPPGPKPPMLCRTRVVFDPNLRAVVWAPTVTEEDAVHG